MCATENRYALFAEQHCVEQGYAPHSRDALVTGLVTELSHGFAAAYSAPRRDSRTESVRDYERRVRRERKHALEAFEKRTHAEAKARIRAEPQAYGFTGLEVLVIGWFISGIVSAICRKLFDMWWGDE